MYGRYTGKEGREKKKFKQAYSQRDKAVSLMQLAYNEK